MSDLAKQRQKILQDIQRCFENDDVSLAKISQIIAEEPILGEKLITYANETLPKNSNHQITTLVQALMQLGEGNICYVYKHLIKID